MILKQKNPMSISTNVVLTSTEVIISTTDAIKFNEQNS
jgi:hypothetical protein